MSTTEHMLIDLQRRIESTLDAVRKQGLGIAKPAATEAAGAYTGMPPVALPRMSSPAPVPLPAALAQRDLQIARELLHLQRTLSRQTFRGAESARRLVRRLIRRAELNAGEITALASARPGPDAMPGGEESPLPRLLDRLASQLSELQALGRTLGAQSTRTDRPSSDTPR